MNTYFHNEQEHQARPDVPHHDNDLYFKTYDGLNIRYQYHKATSGTPKAVFILLNGRREYIEMYDKTIQKLISKDFDVWTMDWRGQGKSDRELSNFQKGFVRSFDDYVTDTETFYEIIEKHYLDNDKGQTMPPVILFGHSMGGHNAIRFALKHPPKVHRMLLSAPMVKIHLPKGVGWVSHLLITLNNAIGWGEKYAIGQRDFYRLPFKGNIVFYDQDNFESDQDFMEKTPSMQLGGVTYRWLQQAMISSDMILDPSQKLEVPTVILTAKDDILVDNPAQEQFAKQHDLCTQIIIDNAIHHTVLDLPHAQDIFWKELEKLMP